MSFVLEELVVNEKGVFLKPEHGGKAVMVTPVGRIVDIRTDGLGNPYHKPEVVDYMFKAHPDEIRGFITGAPHDHKISIQYYACRVMSEENGQQASQH